MNLADAKRMERNYLASIGGHMNTTEGDMKLNSINRAIIRTYKREKGRCFLINILDKKMVEYKKGMICNFAYNCMTYREDVANTIHRLSKEDPLEALKYAEMNNVEYLVWI